MQIQSALSGAERVFSYQLARYELYDPRLVNVCAVPQTACGILPLCPDASSPLLLQARLPASVLSLSAVAGRQGLSAYRLVQVLHAVLCGMMEAESAGFDSGNFQLDPDQIFLSDAEMKPTLLYLPLTVSENNAYNFRMLYQKLVPQTPDAQMLDELTAEFMRGGNTLEDMKALLEAHMPRRKESSPRRRPEEENQVTHYNLQEKVSQFSTKSHIRQTYAGRPEIQRRHPQEALFKTFQKVLLTLLGFALLCVLLMGLTGIRVIPYLAAVAIAFAALEIVWLILRRATLGDGRLKKQEWAHLRFCYPDGSMTSTPIPVDRTPFCIGRDPKWSQLTLTDGCIARKHASITREKGVFYLVDHHSTNGTTLNGRPVAPGRPERLRSGDCIAFAGKPYRFTAS